MTRQSQADRVLRALEGAGPRGVTAVDFQLPSVCDDGSPILRVAARVRELREAGHRIVEAGRRDRCVIYRLERWEPIATPAQGALFQSAGGAR